MGRCLARTLRQRQLNTLVPARDRLLTGRTGARPSRPPDPPEPEQVLAGTNVGRRFLQVMRIRDARALTLVARELRAGGDPSTRELAARMRVSLGREMNAVARSLSTARPAPSSG